MQIHIGWFILAVGLLIYTQIANKMEKAVEKKDKKSVDIDINVDTQKARYSMILFHNWIENECKLIEKRLQTLEDRINHFHKTVQEGADGTTKKIGG